MTRRISFLSTRLKRASQGAGALGRELTGPLRKFSGRISAPVPFAARPAYLPLTLPSAGQAIVDGRIMAAGQALEIGASEHPWAQTLPSENFAARLHGFDWLHDLAALSQTKHGTQAAPRAQQLTDDWAQIYSGGNVFADRPDIVARRCYALLTCWGAVLSADRDIAPLKAGARRTMLARQIGNLKTAYKRLDDGEDKLRAVTTLALAGAMLSDTALLDKNLDRLDDALERQVLGDGGHIGRRPAATASILQGLLALEDALKIRGIAGSKQTRRAIDRLAPALGFFDMGDGSTASFNGSGLLPASCVKALLKKSGARSSRTFSYMPHTGYQRLQRADAVLIMDVAGSPPRPFDTTAHLAPLAFELSIGGKPLIVNCGYNENQPEGWRQIVRETAAHSTLIIDECSAGEIVSSGARLKAFGPAIASESGPASAQRMEEGEDIWLEGQHEGYRKTTGLDHRRRIYLTGDGSDVRGEDSLYIPLGSEPVYHGARFAFKARFHLHPDVRATLSRDRRSALLILPGGEGWRFRTDGVELSLEPSVYLARAAQPERCEQLVVSGDALSDNDGEDRSNRVRWSFKRVSQDEGR